MDRKSYRSAFKPINFLVVLWITSVIIHGISGLIVLYNEQYLLNDSVIYLTMAHNFKIYGVISQSFYEPIVPDFQRSPLYPIFLSLVPVPYVVFFQHLLILLAGYFIQKLTIFFNYENKIIRYAGVLFTLIPYSIHLPSLVMSETLFIFFLTILGIHFLFFIYQPQWKYLLIVVLFSLLACYTRASMLPFLLWIGLAIGFLNRSFIKTFVFFLIVFIGIFPWIYRNYSYTGQWFFTSASQITTYYGRIGGTVLALDKNMNQDAYLKVSADEYLSHRYALHSIKKYHQEIINEENEQIQVPFMEIYLNQQWSMPFHAIIFQLRCIYQQMTGLSYGMSQFLYQSQFIAIFMAILQAIFMVWIYGSFIYLSGRTPEKRLMLLWSASIIFWLLIHNAAWADGRYRYVTDLWSILGIIVLNRKTS